MVFEESRSHSNCFVSFQVCYRYHFIRDDVREIETGSISLIVSTFLKSKQGRAGQGK